jgi:hypothetical protein
MSGQLFLKRQIGAAFLMARSADFGYRAPGRED